MKPGRLEAFTDGIVAIIITITVLEMRVPHAATLAGLREVAPVLVAYALSFANVGLYWNNHHHMLAATERIDGSVLWANLFMLFWMSLVPWVIRWLDEAGFGAMPTAAYGVVMGMTAIGYIWTQARIIAVNGHTSAVARAVGHDRKGRISLALYLAAIAIAFVAPLAADAIYVGIAILWFVPDRRIERQLSR
ncbi:TMEM175 family protein [Sphingomonas nostoxanthinifaciens]|uniref:TMEM175 family protein n=1 Tax=Sphingomonas nostoxanthinifaciens TaxID=2872652 RepID=UPI001CC1E1EC|nr:TMEM175 family protein [Sphingomonas nostoxanthinifaciens]UAK23895.1 TMEM175 family protein [Sphingomonas nostoxanthinifaciens]